MGRQLVHWLIVAIRAFLWLHLGREGRCKGRLLWGSGRGKGSKTNSLFKRDTSSASSTFPQPYSSCIETRIWVLTARPRPRSTTRIWRESTQTMNSVGAPRSPACWRPVWSWTRGGTSRRLRRDPTRTTTTFSHAGRSPWNDGRQCRSGRK